MLDAHDAASRAAIEAWFKPIKDGRNGILHNGIVPAGLDALVSSARTLVDHAITAAGREQAHIALGQGDE